MLAVEIKSKKTRVMKPKADQKPASFSFLQLGKSSASLNKDSKRPSSASNLSVNTLSSSLDDSRLNAVTTSCISPPSFNTAIKTQGVKAKSDFCLDELAIEEGTVDDFTFGDLIIVSNRLPMTITRKKACTNNACEHPFTYQKSSGGLVTALTGMNREFTWIGWTGSEVPDEQDQSILKKELLQGYNQFPVFLEKEEATLYYDGFCNGVLWPVFHYMYEKNVTYKQEEWEAYKKVNEKFVDSILQVYKENDCVW